jgi:hypothetical protein
MCSIVPDIGFAAESFDPLFLGLAGQLAGEDFLDAIPDLVDRLNSLIPFFLGVEDKDLVPEGDGV